MVPRPLLWFTCVLLASCGGGAGGVCDEAASVSFYCGGYEVPPADRDACVERVATACTDVDQADYASYLACVADRCRNFSPERRVAVSCDRLAAAISPACFASGVTGSSDYRFCAGGVDGCRSGTTCDPVSATCQPSGTNEP